MLVLSDTVLECFHEVVVCLLRVSQFLVFIFVTAVNEEQLKHGVALTLSSGFLEVLDGFVDVLNNSEAVVVEHADMVSSNNIALVSTLIVKLRSFSRLLLSLSSQLLVRVASGCTGLSVT